VRGVPSPPTLRTRSTRRAADRDTARNLQYPVPMFRLLPLETQTLPGWETAATPSAIEVVGLLLGVPLAIFAVILLLGMAPSWLNRSGDEVAVRHES